jgi:predicted nucleic acid-binding protein
MIGLDTSFVVAFEVQSHPFHAAARRVAAEYAAEGLAVAPQVLAELIHVVTDDRRFQRPLAVSDAIARSRRWWMARETRRVYPTDDAVVLFHDWLVEPRLGRKRLLDVLLAATYQSAGIGVIASSDARGFRCFPGIHPLLIG